MTDQELELWISVSCAARLWDCWCWYLLKHQIQMLAIIVRNSPRAADESLRFLLCPDVGLLSLPEHSDQWGRGGFLHCTSTNPSRSSSTESEAHRWTGGCCWVACKLWAYMDSFAHLIPWYRPMRRRHVTVEGWLTLKRFMYVNADSARWEKVEICRWIIGWWHYCRIPLPFSLPSCSRILVLLIRINWLSSGCVIAAAYCSTTCSPWCCVSTRASNPWRVMYQWHLSRMSAGYCVCCGHTDAIKECTSNFKLMSDMWGCSFTITLWWKVRRWFMVPQEGCGLVAEQHDEVWFLAQAMQGCLVRQYYPF